MSQSINEKVEMIVVDILSSIDKDEYTLMLPHIIRKLQHHLNLRGEQGKIISAMPLDKKYIGKIEKILEEKLQEKVVLQNEVEESIVGGFIITFKDIVIDISLKKQLDEIKNTVYGS